MQYDQNHALLSTEIPELTAVRRGKVRDVYDLGDSILFVATDRISAFDCVMPNGIPGKGRVLAQVTLNWFKVLTGIKNHLITADVSKYPAVLQKYAADLEGRSMLVRKLNMLPVECIVRGYLTGSGWSSYQKTGKVCGIPLRDGYQNASKLDEPIFTPTTKAETGHDEAISFEELSSQIGSKLADALRNASIALYNQAAEYALKRGIIITPDSSRFWPVDSYQVGKNPPSLDKQFVRDWLDSVHFNHQPPAPELPPEVVQKTREKYEEALESLKVRG